MTFTRLTDNATLQPILVFGPHEEAREVKNIARELLHSSIVKITFVPTDARTGEYQLLFETHAQARAGFSFFDDQSLFRYSGPDTPGTPGHPGIPSGELIQDGGIIIESPGIPPVPPGPPGPPDASFAFTFLVWGGPMTITQNSLWELRVPYKEVFGA
jgi:hypothetical protein